MKDVGFAFTDLLPSLGLVFGGDVNQSAEVFSARVVAVLLAVFFGFAVYSTAKFFRARHHVVFYTNLLADASPETLVEKRRDLLNSCKADIEHYHLWREFNESLVEFQSGEQRRLGNTLDAAFFFNSATLSRNLTENRLIAAVPGFLTAIGVIGTFAGLQMGLASLDLGGNTSVGTIREGIGAVIAGASIAFLTSVWGVLLSVLFNFGEKFLERRIKLSITQLQIRIDELFPRYTAENALAQILTSNKESQLALQGLAEKIGNKMQEALVETSNTINKGLEEALNRIMAPAIESLVDNANKGSEEALSALMERFMSGIGDLGERQKVALDGAADNVQASVTAMGSQMENFAGYLARQTQQADKRESERVAQLKEQFDSLLQGASGSINAVTDSVNAQIQQMQALDGERQQHFLESVDHASERHQALSERISALTTNQQQTHESIMGQLQALSSSFSELIEGNHEAASAMLNSSREMNASSNQLGVLSSNVKEASRSLSEEINTAVAASSELAERNKEVSDKLALMIEGIARVNEASGQLVSGLQHSSELVNNSVAGMEGHLETVVKTMAQQMDSVFTTMKSHVDEVNKQVGDLLDEYAGRVNAQTQDRLNEWNKQTMEYTGNMTSAINAISSVVDEIESKVRA